MRAINLHACTASQGTAQAMSAHRTTSLYSKSSSIIPHMASAYPVKLTVVQSVTRPLSPAMFRNSQFSQPRSTNCSTGTMPAMSRGHISESCLDRRFGHPTFIQPWPYLWESLDQFARQAGTHAFTRLSWYLSSIVHASYNVCDLKNFCEVLNTSGSLVNV